MLKEKRLQMIMGLLKQEGEVQSSNLCKMFGVTDMTIRRDLDTLASEEGVVRTHGGAIYNGEGKLLEPSYATRATSQLSAKESIARKALKFFTHGMYVFLDSGTTTLHLAKQLSGTSGNTFITNGLNIASELITCRNLSVILIGGDLHSNSLATRGTAAERQLSDFRFDIAFLGCNAISPEGDVLVGNLTETGIKRQALKIAHKVYLLADSSKFDQYSLVSYASVKDFNGIITDNNIKKETEKRIIENGGKLIISS